MPPLVPIEPMIALLAPGVGLVGFGATFWLVARELRRTVQPHWRRTTGWWGPWRPPLSQRVHYVVDGVEHHVVDLSTIRLPKRGPIDVRYDPTRPFVAIIDTGGEPGEVAKAFAFLFWTAATLCIVLAFVIPHVVDLVEATLQR